MGSGVSSKGASGSDIDSQRHKHIESMLRKEKAEQERTLKLLLLGAAESGKSTFVKQMRILHKNGYPEEERLEIRDTIHACILEAMADIIEVIIARSLPNLVIEDIKLEAMQRDMNKLLLFKEGVQKGRLQFNHEVAALIKEVWNEPLVQRCVARRSEFNLSDSILYYIGKLEEISHCDYLPCDQDILLSRVRTSGVNEIFFECKGYTIKLLDVGGQRSERRKWIHQFDNVTAIIFTAAISEYDQVLTEDGSTNRMVESLNLFGSICNSPYFNKTSVILFLNKKDLFAIKIKTVPLTVAFPNYDGDNSFEAATIYVQFLYESRKKDKDREIYTHLTNATDTRNINFVFDAMMAVVMKKNMETAGML